MKTRATVIFIFCILLGLTLICIVFPEDGISIGNIKLKFPTLSEALTPAPSTQTDSIRKIDKEVEQQIDALHNAKQKEFDNFCKNSPTRIYMPDNNVEYLDPLFEALDNARNKSLRILHYGDSQLECDRMTSAIRERFQSMFGGCGVGMIPAVQPIATYTLRQSISPSLNRYCAFGSADFRASHNRYGPLAAMSRIDGQAMVSVNCYNNKKFEHSQKFQKVSVAMRGNGTISLTTADSTFLLSANTAADSTLRTYSVTLPAAVSKATINFSGNMDVYSIMLDGKNGIAMDNIPMRGCSGTIFTNIDRSSFAPFFNQHNVSLVILQYGGNAVPYLNGAKGIEAYKKQIKSQIRLFRQMAPKARILFIGPSDMSTRQGGMLQSYPHIEEVISALRQAANEEGAAFWNMYKAMGGHNSMIEWVNARPQLAGSDYIHFTPLGAEKMSQILFDTMQLYYRFYRFRTGQALPEDTVESHDSTKINKQQDSLTHTSHPAT